MYDDVPRGVWAWPLLSGIFWIWSFAGWSTEWADGVLNAGEAPIGFWVTSAAFLCLLIALFVGTNCFRVRERAGALEVRRFFFGLPMRLQRIRLDDVRAVSIYLRRRDADGDGFSRMDVRLSDGYWQVMLHSHPDGPLPEMLEARLQAAADASRHVT